MTKLEKYNPKIGQIYVGRWEITRRIIFRFDGYTIKAPILDDNNNFSITRYGKELSYSEATEEECRELIIAAAKHGVIIESKSDKPINYEIY